MRSHLGLGSVAGLLRGLVVVDHGDDAVGLDVREDHGVGVLEAVDVTDQGRDGLQVGRLGDDLGHNNVGSVGGRNVPHREVIAVKRIFAAIGTLERDRRTILVSELGQDADGLGLCGGFGDVSHGGVLRKVMGEIG